MLTYHQRSGQMVADDGVVLDTGYAGKGSSKNDPDAQDVPNEGPLPRGLYTILAPVDTKTHGPYVLWLEPDAANQMCGRSSFGIHGDSVVHPGEASEGCIILPRSIRELIWQSGDHRLEVVS